MRTRLITLVALLLTSALTSCTDSSATDPSPWPSPPRTTPAATATAPVLPTLPAAATQRDTPAVKAFIRYWVDVFNYSAATGDTEPLKEISNIHCVTCSSIIRKVEAIYGAGGHTEGKGWSVRYLWVRDPAHVTAKVKVWPQVAVLKAGEQPQQSAGSRLNLAIALDLTDAGWAMLAMDKR